MLRITENDKDIPSKNPGRTEMRGKILGVLKMSLTKGFFNITKEH